MAVNRHKVTIFLVISVHTSSNKGLIDFYNLIDISSTILIELSGHCEETKAQIGNPANFPFWVFCKL